MKQLKELIDQSRSWASVDRGATLFALASGILQNTFKIEAGMFVYKRHFLPSRTDGKFEVFEPWGIEPSAIESASRIVQSTADPPLVAMDRWIDVKEAPEKWRDVWESTGVRHFGIWRLTVQERVAGAIVLGRKSPPGADDGDYMSACATYMSMVLEMLMLRRVAQYESHHDPLTGIFNRRGLMAAIEALDSTPGSLIVGLLDVDGFKKINDSLGHMTGDMTLIDVAHTLEQNITHDGVCGRFGGDEFVFCWRTSGMDVDSITELVRSWFRDKSYHVSTGCALWDREQSDWPTAFGAADRHLYLCKQP